MFATASLTSQGFHGNQAPPGVSNSDSTGKIHCSSHPHHLPVLTPLLLLVCPASPCPLKSACFVWQKRAARKGCLQHGFGGKEERK